MVILVGVLGAEFTHQAYRTSGFSDLNSRLSTKYVWNIICDDDFEARHFSNEKKSHAGRSRVSRDSCFVVPGSNVRLQVEGGESVDFLCRGCGSYDEEDDVVEVEEAWRGFFFSVVVAASCLALPVDNYVRPNSHGYIFHKRPVIHTGFFRCLLRFSFWFQYFSPFDLQHVFCAY